MTGNIASQAFAGIGHICRIIGGRWATYVLMVISLAVAYCAAIIIGLYVCDELTYDSFIPHSDKIYLVTAKYGPAGRPLVDSDVAPAGVARWVKSDLSEVDHVARLVPEEWPVRTSRHWAKELFYWADADIFQVLDVPALHGNLATALSHPGSVVLTRRLALAYFGRSDAIGQILTINGNIPLKVTAILKDLPENTHFNGEMFVSGDIAYSKLSRFDYYKDALWPNSYIYIKFKIEVDAPAASADILEITRRHWQGPNIPPDAYSLIPINKLHFQPDGDGQMKPRGHLDSVLALTGVALAILVLAGINFSGLIMAERQERTAEMSLLSALGASRFDLIGQILREALILSGLSAWLGLAAAERLLPELDSLLDLRMTLWAHPPSLIASVVAVAVVLALEAGIAPAIILSRLAKASSLARPEVSMRWRSWVVAQLVLVIILLTASYTMSRQWGFATSQSLGFDADNVVIVRLVDSAPINAAFLRDIGSVPGVVSAAGSWGAPRNDYVRAAWTRRPGGPLIFLRRNSFYPDFLKVYGVQLLAGRNLSGTFVTPEIPREVLINMAAVKALGFHSPEDAVGQILDYDADRTHMRSTVAGVLPDIRISTVYEPVTPMIFDNFSKYVTQVNIRIDPARTSDTLQRIDALWQRASGGSVPIDRSTFIDYLNRQYHVLRQQMLAFDTVSGAAIILSVLELMGFSIFLTRHQMREIAIHKALGATFGDLFVQRMIPFLAPSLVANLIAWPIAWLLLSGWLNAFADHVNLSLVSFAGPAATVTMIALLTVAIHSAFVCRSISTASLRHE